MLLLLMMRMLVVGIIRLRIIDMSILEPVQGSVFGFLVLFARMYYAAVEA